MPMIKRQRKASFVKFHQHPDAGVYRPDHGRRL